MTKLEPRRLLLSVAAPVLALLVAFVVTSLVLVAVGDPVADVWKTMLAAPGRARWSTSSTAPPSSTSRPSRSPSASG